MAKKTTNKDKLVLKMSLGTIITEFFPAITQLGTLAIKDIDVTWAISQAKRQAKSHVSDYNAARTQLAEASCLKDADGKPIIENKRYQYKTEAEEVETNNLIIELEKKELEIEVKQFPVSVLKGVEGVTGNAVEACGDMFIEP